MRTIGQVGFETSPLPLGEHAVDVIGHQLDCLAADDLAVTASAQAEHHGSHLSHLGF
jgi:hypothetical protein